MPISTLGINNAIPLPNGKKRISRISERICTNGEVLIHDGSYLYLAPLDNIGTDGLFLKRLSNFELGTFIKLAIRSPELDSPIQLTGTVVRADKSNPGTGIEFISYFGRSKEIIQKCIQKHVIEAIIIQKGEPFFELCLSAVTASSERQD